MERNDHGFSAFAGRDAESAEARRNGACPGTGGIWQSESEGAHKNNGGSGASDDISWDELKMAHEQCSKHQLAMVYSPHQCWRKLYSPDTALMRGTLFEELDKPLEDCRHG